MNNKQDFASDDGMGFGDRIAAYHKKLLEKNPLAISVTLVVSMMHLKNLGFVDMFIEGLVCYAIAFYVVPAVCNGDLCKTTSENFENWTEDSCISLRNSRFKKTSIDTKCSRIAQSGRYDMNLNNPSSPLYKLALSKKL